MILVTGANGFVGNVLVKRLVSEGKKVRAFCRSESHVSEFRKLGVDVAYGDVKDSAAVLEAMKGVSAVVHLASVHGRISLKEMNKTNVEGVRNVLKAAVAEGVEHVVHYSSIAVYGEAQGVNEESEKKPYDDYGKSKKAGEDLIKYFTMGHPELKVSIIRPPHIYGPGGKSNLSNMFRMVSKKRYPVIGSGKGLINAVYITDLLDATLLLLNKKECWGKDFIIADDRAYTLKEFSNLVAKACNVSSPMKVPYSVAYVSGAGFEILEKVTGKRLPLSRSRVKNVARSRSFLIGKAIRELGYQPKVHFEEGAVKAYRWYKENGLL